MSDLDRTSFSAGATERVSLTFRKAKPVDEAPEARPLTPYDKAAAKLDAPEARAARLAQRKADADDEGAFLEREMLPAGDIDEEIVLTPADTEPDQTAFGRTFLNRDDSFLPPSQPRSPLDIAHERNNTPEAKAARLAQRQRSRDMDFER